MAENVTNELILEHLKRIQDRLNRMDHKIDDLGADIRSLKSHQAGFMSSEIAQDGAIAEVRARLDRIEDRLELRDQ